MTAILSLLCSSAVYTANADSLVKGRIHLKNGSVIECGEKDRIKIPKRHGDIKLFRNAFYKNKSKEVFPQKDVDSIVCWHKMAPEYTRKFVPSEEAGLLWVYFDTPYICVCIYSKKRLRHIIQRGYRDMAAHRPFQPVAYGLLPSEKRR